MEGTTVAHIARRSPAGERAARLTNFYPTYDDANDQVDAVLPVRRAWFQRVVPRYRLSTSETRDQGVGPQFITVPYGPTRRTTSQMEPGLAAFSEAGVLVDVYA